MLHWEDLGTSNARRVIDRYRDHYLTFNDDMQGTGAVTLAVVFSAVRSSGVPLSEQRIVVFGSGTAGIGIADQLRDAMVADGSDFDAATRQVWCVGRHGLLTDDRTDLRTFQAPYARPAAEVTNWTADETGGYSLEEVVRQVKPTILIGTSGVPGAFNETIVRLMAANVGRPIILPMSNPTTLAEATPADILRWTDGLALVATGSPFPDVEYNGTTYYISQANNAHIFPGLGLGIKVAGATRCTDGLLRAAAKAVAGLVDHDVPGGRLLPRVMNLRQTSLVVAVAVARQAAAEGINRREVGADIVDRVREAMWQPTYYPVRPIGPGAAQTARGIDT